MSESFLKLPEVMRRTGASRASVYAWMMAGTFPRALKRGRAALWLESEVQTWIDAQAATLPRMGQSMGARRPDKKKPLVSAA